MISAAASTTVHTHRGTRAVQRMVEVAPSTGGLALWMGHRDLPDDVAAAPAVTDGTTIYYHASFERLPIRRQVGVVAHEVLHVALRHPQRYLDLRRTLGDVDLRLFTICADAIVNSTLGHLGWLDLPDDAVTLDVLLKDSFGVEVTVETALLDWDVERLYRALDDRLPLPQNPGGKSGRPAPGRIEAETTGTGSGGRSFMRREMPAVREDGPRSGRARALGADADTDIYPVADTEGPPEAEADRAREWSERLIRAHAGDGEFSMLRTLLADLPKSRTPWEQVLRTRLAKSLGRKPDVSWSRPSRSYIANQGRGGPHRRLPWEPGFVASRKTPRLALVVDVSGSIEDDLMQKFAREVEAITRRLEAGLLLIIGDVKVRNVEWFEPGRSRLRDMVFEGGGGTDFSPLLEEADRHHPDICVVLTDLDGPARFVPRWPVIWAVTEAHARAVPPFGQLLVLR
ncbi:hypothetical protein A33M_2751 [Rhodovulum sp. PH10]|uniref:vWA domain-containing protein n=1 Tax=Rhodovulum sp. PH10 TaxID=1187851 RepID=UPI00027C266E|nr:VWA-like domain-containing protein [Rhodovulum sp. PH10]EJW11768.1 hypothetical protein A33M_2751 [Rhodovulum sp. PH10]